jgi:hypothetical protein
MPYFKNKHIEVQLFFFNFKTIYLDARVNRKPTIIRSMFNACLMAAFRFHAIVKHILMRCPASSV